MTVLRMSNVFYILWAGLLGLVAFLLSGLLAAVVVFRTDNYILGMLITGALGSLLLGLGLKMGKRALTMAFTGAFVMPIGLMLAFGIFEGLGALLYAIGLKIGPPGAADTMAIMFMSGFFAAAIGACVYGKKAIPLFFVLSSLVALPFGAMVVAFNLEVPLRFTLQSFTEPLGPIDLNGVLISLAAGLGASLGIASKERNSNSS